jgi:hypothetical protein
MKRTRSKKSRDTFPLTLFGYIHSLDGLSPKTKEYPMYLVVSPLDITEVFRGGAFNCQAYLS